MTFLTALMESLARNFRAIKRRKFFRYGVPFLLFMVGGSFGLREFTNLKFQFSKKTLVNPEDLKKEGIDMKKPQEVTLEAEFEKIKKIDIDNWEQKRGPRPWEEGA